MTSLRPLSKLALLLAAFALAIVAALLCGGCQSTIKGGTSSHVEERAVQTPGESRTEGRTTTTTTTGEQRQARQDAVVQVGPDGTIIVRVGHADATTQPIRTTTEATATATTRPTVVTESTRTSTATTQPSASSSTGLPHVGFGDDGNATGVWFDADHAAANLKARSYLIVPLALAGIGFLFFKRWLPGGVCLACAAAVAIVSQWLVDVVFGAGVAGGAAFLVYEIVVKHRKIQDLVGGNAPSTPTTPTGKAV